MTGCFLSSLLRYDSFQTASNALDKEPLEAPAAGVYRRPGKLLVHHVRPTDVITPPNYVAPHAYMSSHQYVCPWPLLPR